MAVLESPPSYSPVARTLAANRLGVAAVVFFVMSAATPLTVVAGVVTTGYSATGLTGIPLSFVLVGAVLAVFSVGYVAMARHVANAGAFYSYISQGIGRPFGVGAAWIALLAYNALQVGLYGAIGSAAAPLLDQWFGIQPQWWVIAIVAWALTALLGVLRVDINGTVLAVLLLAEVAVILVYSVADLANPAGGQISFETLSPGNLWGPGVGAILVLAVLGFVGFESAVVFSEESKDPRRTITTATYLSVGLIAALYAFASWAMTVATGPENIVLSAGEQGPELIFNLAGSHLGQTVVDIGHALFVTSIVAAMISFHNTTSRYMFALGRERVLPAALGRTARSTGAPRNASLLQSAIGLVVIVGYAVAGWDPLVQLFFWGGTSGALGVLFLIAFTSIAVIVFFARNQHGENVWRRLAAPAAATVALGVIVYLALDNFATLLGVDPSHVLAWAVPVAYLVAAIAGIGWGLLLKLQRPDVYRGIGLGAKSATIGIEPPAPAALTAAPAAVPVVRATHADADLAADLIAEAFAGLDATAWLVPDPSERRAVLRDNFRIFVDHALEHGEVHLADGGTGVAVWFFADREIPQPADYDQRLAEACGVNADRFAVLDTLFADNHPHEAHHHLAFLAVRPERQGAGIGTALLAHHHARLDEHSMPAYLDASSTGSRELYARHGYELREPFRLPDGTAFWPMWRPPAG